MITQDFFKSKLFKFFIILFIIVCVIKIFGAGYGLGQWIYSQNH